MVYSHFLTRISSCMKGFVKKRIFLQEIAKICQTLFSSHNKKKKQFLTKSCIPWVDLMQNLFL